MALTQISTAGVKDDAVTSGKIPANAVGSSELADNAVDTAAIADNAVTAAKIADSTITNTQIAANAIGTGRISDDAITAAKLADNAVDTAAIVDSAVTAAKIGAEAVTNAKIQTNAVDDRALASNSVVTGVINNGAVTSDKIGDEQVTLSKLPHGTSSNDGKFLRANNGADPTFETVTGTTINNNADNRIITGSGTANTLEGEANLTYDGNELKSVLGSNSPKLTLKRSGNVSSEGDIFSQISTEDANGTVVGELTWRREGANDQSWLDLETKKTGVNNAQASVRIKGSNGTLYAVGDNGRDSNNQAAYMTDEVYGSTTVNSVMSIRTRTNGGDTGLLVRGVSQGGGSTNPHSCIRVDATACGNNADQYGIYLRGRQQLSNHTTGYYGTVSGSYSTTYVFRAHLEKNVAAYSNGYSFHSKISETNSGGSSYHFRGDDGTTQKVRIEKDGDLDNANNSYGGLSDVKLKENIVDAGSQWEDIKAIKVRNYNFKASTGLSTFKQLGVVAQELETVSAGLIKTENDIEIDESTGEGKVTGTTKSVKYSVLYMKALKALQEAMEKIEVLETKVAALEAG